VLVIGAILFFLFILAGSLIFDTYPGVMEFPSAVTGQKELGFIKYTLFAQDISFFIVPSVIILTKLNPGYETSILNIKALRINEVILVTILAFCAFPVTSLTGQLNSEMVLPDWLSGVEEWMKDKEVYANQLLDLIMTPDTFLGMCLNMLIIAALPAVSEELIFRGVFQKIFQNLFKSGHLAVWFTSFLFSAIHFQFYGFLPRFILGLIFGYLFLWSRNLWLPVIAHFINNAAPTIGAYIKGWKTINAPSTVGLGKQIAWVMVFLTIVIIILAWFRQQSSSDIKGNPDGFHSPGA
jgi:membrane protease YdiL (CAAX protease family)